MSLKLEEIPFKFEGKTYQLRCNMAVLEEVQEENGGDLFEVLSSENAVRSALVFLTAMLNDYADEQGWPERWTRKQVGRKLPMSYLNDGLIPTVMGLVTRSLTPPKEQNKTAEAEPEGN